MQINNAVVMSHTPRHGQGKYAGKIFYKANVHTSLGDTITLDFGSQMPPPVGANYSGECEDTMTYGAYKIVRPAWNGGGGAPSAPRAPSAGSAPAASTGFPLSQSSHQISIVRQNSMGHAVNLVANHFDVFFAGRTEGEVTEDELIQKVVEIAFYVSEFSSGALEVDVKGRLADKLKK